MSEPRKIVIANCGGFWGDDPTAARRQVEGGPVDYLVMDYLAEVTMAILQKQRSRDPESGYARDFLAQLRDVLPTCPEGGGNPGVDCWPPPEVPNNVNTAELGDLGLSEADEWALVEFLKTLDDGYMP